MDGSDLMAPSPLSAAGDEISRPKSTVSARNVKTDNQLNGQWRKPPPMRLTANVRREEVLPWEAIEPPSDSMSPTSPTAPLGKKEKSRKLGVFGKK